MLLIAANTGGGGSGGGDSAGHAVVSAAAGGKHTALLTRSGGVLTCGCNEHGQLGLFGLGHSGSGSAGAGRGSSGGGGGGGGTNGAGTPARATATAVASLAGERAVTVAAGGAHTLVLVEGGGVFSFGCGQHGRLGHGDELRRRTPGRVL
jgi:alpha-tubulin suppressor-like RCC1 family protein